MYQQNIPYNNMPTEEKLPGAYNRKDLRKMMVGFLLLSALCLVFSTIYNRYSHGVTSSYMTFLCLFPLLLGAIPSFLLSIHGFLPLPFQLSMNLYNTGLAAVTLSSAMRGIFEIAGTGSVLQVILMIIGILFLIAGALVYIFQSIYLRLQSDR
jgi:hypothetical protein